MKTLVTFVHFKQQPHAETNLKFFLSQGLLKNEDIKYNFVINGQGCSAKIPKYKNVQIIKGHNRGYDWGGYKQSLDSEALSDFDYFIFINDTCRGPFLPKYIPKSINWVDLFLSGLSDKVKMVGATSLTEDYVEWLQEYLFIEAGKNKHIQSYCFGVDKTALNILLTHQKFSCIGKPKNDIIKEHEISSSQLLLDKGFDISSMQLSELSGEKTKDVNYEKAYFETTINPLEVMFIKTNRINNQVVKNYTKWILP